MPRYFYDLTFCNNAEDVDRSGANFDCVQDAERAACMFLADVVADSMRDHDCDVFARVRVRDEEGHEIYSAKLVLVGSSSW